VPKLDALAGGDHEITACLSPATEVTPLGESMLPNDTTKPWLAVAAAYVLVAAACAVTEQVPAPVKITVAPLSEHPVEEPRVKVTGPPLATALTVYEPPTRALAGGVEVNSID
jgi:hypothetical protein